MKTRKHGSGRLVKRPGDYEAFIPDPLPPRIDFTAKLLRVLSDADRLIGQLAGSNQFEIVSLVNGLEVQGSGLVR